ncbi:hypothetical protein JXI42_04470 [bacterium]|nr:hypothetical protein [bacterium]
MITKSIIFLLILLCAISWFSCTKSWEGHPKDPVILNEMTIPEDRITRAPNNDVTEIYLDRMGLTDPDCLYGIEEYKQTLTLLSLFDNLLTSLDVTPLYSLNNLEYLYLHENDFDSAACEEICNLTTHYYFSGCVHDCECLK